MKPLIHGHLYELDHLDGSGKTHLQFVSREPLHDPREGVINQEVLRALIDRVECLNEEVPWAGNADILHHLRMALVLHEARALVRHVQKGELRPETLVTGADGHFVFASAEDRP